MEQGLSSAAAPAKPASPFDIRIAVARAIDSNSTLRDVRFVLHICPSTDDWVALFVDQEWNRTTNGLEQHMKSIGLALTLFSLTGTLVALDLSGVHQVKVATTSTAQPLATAAGESTADPEKLETEADDEVDGKWVSTFLVTSQPTPAPSGEATALRYY